MVSRIFAVALVLALAASTVAGLTLAVGTSGTASAVSTQGGDSVVATSQYGSAGSSSQGQLEAGSEGSAAQVAEIDSAFEGHVDGLTRLTDRLESMDADSSVVAQARSRIEMDGRAWASADSTAERRAVIDSMNEYWAGVGERLEAQGIDVTAVLDVDEAGGAYAAASTISSSKGGGTSSSGKASADVLANLGVFLDIGGGAEAQASAQAGDADAAGNAGVNDSQQAAAQTKQGGLAVAVGNVFAGITASLQAFASAVLGISL